MLSKIVFGLIRCKISPTMLKKRYIRKTIAIKSRS